MSAPTTRTCLEAALDYAERGIPVFPCHYPTAGDGCSCGEANCGSIGKHPSTAHGFKDASANRDAITEWWEKHPAANIGIPTGAVSGIVVLDIDVKDGVDGFASLDALAQEHGELPPTPIARTGSGGRHYCFAHPGPGNENRIPNSSGKIGRGLDIRGDGGYIVAAPSIHASGARYEWEGAGLDIPLAHLPDWLLKLILAPAPKPKQATPRPNNAAPKGRQPQQSDGDYWFLKALEKAAPGNRNHTGLWLAGQLRDSGLSESQAESIMRQYADSAPGGEHPYTIAEATASLRSAYSRPRREPARSTSPKSSYTPRQNQVDEALADEQAHDHSGDEQDYGQGEQDHGQGEQDHGDTTQDEPTPKPEPLVAVDAVEMIHLYPELQPFVIDGLLREGEVANLIAASKSRKTYLAINLALCVATGRCWLDRHRVQSSRVLYIDAELHRKTFARRLASVADAMGILSDEFVGRLSVLSLRGRLRGIDTMGSYFASIAGQYKLIVLDTLYRLLPAGTDENSNGNITMVYNLLDRIAEQTGAAVLVIHHSSKGLQSGKAITDVGSGAGAQSRAPDTHIVLRDHQEEGCIVMESALRSFAPQSPVAMRWTAPLWRIDEVLDPYQLREAKPRNRQAAQAKPDEPVVEPWTAERFAKTLLTDSPLDKKLILARAKAIHNLAYRRSEDLICLGIANNCIFRWVYPNDRAVYLASIEQPVTCAQNSKESK